MNQKNCARWKKLINWTCNWFVALNALFDEFFTVTGIAVKVASFCHKFTVCQRAVAGLTNETTRMPRSPIDFQSAGNDYLWNYFEHLKNRINKCNCRYK